MANYYGNPAQAKFIDTYVPIPFDALMGLSQNASLERQANEKRLDDIRVKYGNFNSRSQTDMNRWNQEVTKPLQDVASRISSNPDAIKGEEGRMLISGVVNNMNYGLLDKLKQNAVNLDEAYKSYDPRWQDNTLKDISNWDTAGNGMYNKQNIPFSTLEELATPYYKDLKDSWIPELSNNKEDVYGITQSDLDRASQTAYNSLYMDPVFNKHMARMGLDKLPPEQRAEIARKMIAQSQTDRVHIGKREIRQDYMEAVKQSNRISAIGYRHSLAMTAKKQAEKPEEINRVDATKMEILKSFQNDKRFTAGEQLTNDFAKTGTVNTSDPLLNKRIKDTTDRYFELANKQRSGKLSTGEMNEMKNLQYIVTTGVPRALGEIGELDYKISQLKQKGLPETMYQPLNDARNKLLEFTLKMDPNTTPGIDNYNRKLSEKHYNTYQNYFNETLQRGVDYLTQVNKISDKDRKDLIDVLGGYRTGSTAENNIDDETVAQMGTYKFHERTQSSNLNKDSKGAQSYKDTENVLGVPGTKAGVLRLLDYKSGSNERYISPNDNSLSGKLSNEIFNNPSVFGYQIQDTDLANQFGSNTAPLLVKSEGGKSTIHVKNVNGRDIPEFAAKQKVQIPVQGLLKWMNNNIQDLNMSEDDKEIINNSDNVADLSPELKKKVAKILKTELGYNPENTKLNGVDYFILDGGNIILEGPESNISYGYNWKPTRGVDYKKELTDATYMDPGISAYENSMITTSSEGYEE